jgi:hypothetical protein
MLHATSEGLPCGLQMPPNLALQGTHNSGASLAFADR